jgi:hypothetical protein
VRAANNVAGGVSFVMLARALGVQKAAGAAPGEGGKKGEAARGQRARGRAA